ncbi:hypothetical protein KTJ89_14585 [Brevibacterium sediminis]|uniref:hypothetical protein n=1 Tax=Brevibacterium sediminis TaxID=1857024 RepID=UPI00217561FF|nr:hypothetical protein [Brevibacterium sediminis]MCS4594211.1 hypothetical protein [Brevibacterium sediminis]
MDEEAMMKTLRTKMLQLFLWCRKVFEAGSTKWWPGLALILVGLLVSAILYLLVEYVFAHSLISVGWHEAMPKIASVFTSPLIVTGVYMLIFRLRAKHRADPLFIVVGSARLGYWLWGLTTTLICVAGPALWLTGVSPMAGATAAFSAVFITIGATLVEQPKPEMKINSLLLLKRVANWQLISGSAVIAMLYESPKPHMNLFTQLGDNRGFMFYLMMLWVIGAGGLTVLLEPLKYKLEEERTSAPPSASWYSSSRYV